MAFLAQGRERELAEWCIRFQGMRWLAEYPQEKRRLVVPAILSLWRHRPHPVVLAQGSLVRGSRGVQEAYVHLKAGAFLYAVLRVGHVHAAGVEFSG